MSDTTNLALPLIEGAQAQKHVTHNEALRILDTLVQLAVLDRDLNAPPATPAEGQRWIVKSSPAPTGAWANHGGQIAAWQDAAWQFSSAKTGWVAYVVDEGALLAWNGAAWVDALTMLSSLQNIALLGLGTTADSSNPFSAKLNNVLFAAKTEAEGGSGDVRCKLSKESAAKTLSFLFQDSFSARAEIGLTGDDDFHFKVSADGSTFVDAIILERATGAAKFNSQFRLTSDISPSQIASNQNDYNPAGLSTASVLRLSTDAARNITGLQGGSDGRVLTVINVGANPIALKNADSGSSAVNRFLFGADLTLAAEQAVALWYDATSSRWRAQKQVGAHTFTTVAATGQLGASDGSAGAPGLCWSLDTNTGFRRIGNDAQAWVAAGADILANDSSGRLGLQSGTIVSGYRVTSLYSANEVGVAAYATHASYTGTCLRAQATRAANAAYSFIDGYSGDGADREFYLDGTGTLALDNATITSGADYAEFFEWQDGNPGLEDRVGVSVVLEGAKIRPATAQDAPSAVIGVVSAKPTVIGDAAALRWNKKYLTDAFGRTVMETYEAAEWEEIKNGHKVGRSFALDTLPDGIMPPPDAKRSTLSRKKLNPSHDPSKPYVPRSERAEWSAIGLMGKLRLRKGRPTGERWIKLRDISPAVEEWLVR
jgi:hypothetical protein